ncbi:hypothetical protein CVU75_02210 [Candidatus Dependentiae bacterium HGW-Dependentiae-1]|nr:MAG: hypothetical protein CVU75_02210 [Candidatus Dependentiae bacterium HGW-Dependentiae-1]
MNKKLILAAGALVFTLILAIPITFFFNKRTNQPNAPQSQQQFALYFQHANALHEKGDYAQAASFYVKAIKTNPEVAQAYYNLGLTLEKLGTPTEALSMYKRALRIDPGYKGPYLHAADIFKKQKNHATALTVVDDYLKRDPQDKQMILLKSSILYDKGDLEKALTLCQELIQKNPSYAQAYIMLGSVYEKMNKIPEEVIAYKKAVELDPANPKAHTALADGYLAQGDYQHWAPEYEWRWRTDAFKKLPNIPLWDGSSLKNKTILLISESGLGDMLQYVRFIPNLKQQGAQVIVLAQKPLTKLFSTLPYIDHVAINGQPIPTADVMTSIMSLPYYFPITQKTVGNTPYIHADQKLVAQWKDQLTSDKNIKIGICWHASPVDAQYGIPQSRRTMTLETIAQLAKTKGVSLYSLQKDWPADELTKYGIKQLSSDFDKTHGAFMDTAAVMKNLDLVITIDTVTAHLAGALNVPVWVMLPVAADVRWMLNRSDTPWYASMKLFRQTKTGDWTSVIQKVRGELEKKVATRHAEKTPTVAA